MTFPGKRVAAPLSLQPAGCAHEPCARQLGSSLFAASGAFIAPEANSRLLLAHKALPAEGRTRALLLPKHAWAIHSPLSGLRGSTLCLCRAPHRNRKVLGYVSHGELCQKHTLAGAGPCNWEKLVFAAHSRAVPFDSLHNALRWRCSLHGSWQLQVPPRT